MSTALSGSTTFIALLNGTIVDSFSASTDFTSFDNFYGFSGIVFDEIQMDVSQASGFALLDNFQTVKAQSVPSVPEPSAILGLLAFAALGLPAAHRMRAARRNLQQQYTS